MKRLAALAWILPCLWLAGIALAAAQSAPRPFQGSIQYEILNQSRSLPRQQMAVMPVSASVKMSETQFAFNQGDGNKTIADARTGELHSLVNLSMMGLGKYHIATNAADRLADTLAFKSGNLVATGQSRDIAGYRAQEYVAALGSEQGNIEIHIWCVPGFCSPVFHWATQVAIAPLPGFPLEYSFKTDAYTMTVSVKKLRYGKVSASAFKIPKGYQTASEQEMQRDIENVMKLIGQ